MPAAGAAAAALGVALAVFFLATGDLAFFALGWAAGAGDLAFVAFFFVTADADADAVALAAATDSPTRRTRRVLRSSSSRT